MSPFDGELVVPEAPTPGVAFAPVPGPEEESVTVPVEFVGPMPEAAGAPRFPGPVSVFAPVVPEAGEATGDDTGWVDMSPEFEDGEVTPTEDETGCAAVGVELCAIDGRLIDGMVPVNGARYEVVDVVTNGSGLVNRAGFA